MRASYSASLLDAGKANRSAYSNIICSGLVRIMPVLLIDEVADPSTCKIQVRLNGAGSSLAIFMCSLVVASSRTVHSATKSAKGCDLIDGRGLY